MKNLIEYSLKEQVEYHNSAKDAYFFGNNVVGASATQNGEWTFLIGPDYTSPNYVSSIKLFVNINGEDIPLEFNMRRIRKSGVFFGAANLNNHKIYVWDFAPNNTCLAVRYIYSDTLNNAKITAKIVPDESKQTILNGALCIKKDTDKYCFGNRETLNWQDRFCSIYFNEDSFCSEQNGEFCVTTTLKNGGGALVFSFSYEQPEIINIDPEKYLDDTLGFWQNWFNKGYMPKIENKRYADAVESILLSVKMQQNRDGGMIAGIRKYANSYVRDTHGGMRMLIATRHYQEAALLLKNIHSRFEKAGFIPNWWSMGSDTFIGHSFFNDASEVTAYYMFMARDYLKNTGDMALINQIMPSIKWAAETQLNWLIEHDYTISFNGDETEQYCCNNDGEEYGTFVVEGYYWEHLSLSFPSAAAALCSLEWYADLTNTDWSEHTEKLRKRIDEVFLKADGTHIWSAKFVDGKLIHHNGNLPNYLLLPLWIGAKLEGGREIDDAAKTKEFIKKSGFLPNCPEAMQGFCGHSMGLYLYCMLKLGDKTEAKRAAEQILNTNLLSMYATVSEFYGPGCVPNGHMCRAFEGGIVGEALIKYFESIQ